MDWTGSNESPTGLGFLLWDAKHPHPLPLGGEAPRTPQALNNSKNRVVGSGYSQPFSLRWFLVLRLRF